MPTDFCHILCANVTHFKYSSSVQSYDAQLHLGTHKIKYVVTELKLYMSHNIS